jgi:hypothetical protein
VNSKLDGSCFVKLSLLESNASNKIFWRKTQYPLNIKYNEKYIEEAVNTKFLGLQIDNL